MRLIGICWRLFLRRGIDPAKKRGITGSTVHYRAVEIGVFTRQQKNNHAQWQNIN
jgi:hypothetical protein